LSAHDTLSDVLRTVRLRTAVSSAPCMRADPAVDSYFERAPARRPFRFHYDGAAPAALFQVDSQPPPPRVPDTAATFVCGFIGCDLKPFNPLIATLPRLLHLPAGGRSALSEQFARMQLASRPLLEGRATVAAVAVDVGYDSEAAFARAFKRLVGMPPAAWRRAHEPAAAGA
jgi:hypothetical protein